MVRQGSSREYKSTKPEYSPLSKGRQGSPLSWGRWGSPLSGGRAGQGSEEAS